MTYLWTSLLIVLGYTATAYAQTVDWDIEYPAATTIAVGDTIDLGTVDLADSVEVNVVVNNDSGVSIYFRGGFNDPTSSSPDWGKAIYDPMAIHSYTTAGGELSQKNNLTSSVTDVATTLPVFNGGVYSTGNYYVYETVQADTNNNSEVVLVTNIVSNDLTVTRGALGSPNTAHGSGAVLKGELIHIANGSSYNVPLRAAPRVAGEHVVRLRYYAYDATDGLESYTIYAKVVGRGSKVDFPGSKLDFGKVEVGDAQVKKVPFYNSGNDSLKVTFDTDLTHFTYSPSSLNMAAGESDTVSITFTPTAAARYEGMFRIASHDTTNKTTAGPPYKGKYTYGFTDRNGLHVIELEGWGTNDVLGGQPVLFVGSNKIEIDFSLAGWTGADSIQFHWGAIPPTTLNGALPNGIHHSTQTSPWGFSLATLDSLAAWNEVYIQIKAYTGGTPAVWTTRTKTMGGRGDTHYDKTDTPIAWVYPLSKDVIGIMMRYHAITPYSTIYQDASQSSGNTRGMEQKVGHWGSEFQAGTWTLKRDLGAGATLTASTIERKSMPSTTYRPNIQATNSDTSARSGDRPNAFNTHESEQFIIDELTLELDGKLGAQENFLLEYTAPAGALGPASFSVKWAYSHKHSITPLIQVNQVGYNAQADSSRLALAYWTGDGDSLSFAEIPMEVKIYARDQAVLAPDSITTLSLIDHGPDGDKGSPVRSALASAIPAADTVMYQAHLDSVGVSFPFFRSSKAWLSGLVHPLLRGWHAQEVPRIFDVTENFTIPYHGAMEKLYKTDNPYPTGNVINTKWFTSSTNIGDWDFTQYPQTVDSLIAISGGTHPTGYWADAGDHDVNAGQNTITPKMLWAYASSEAFWTDDETQVKIAAYRDAATTPEIFDLIIAGVYGEMMLQETSGPESGAVRPAFESSVHPSSWGFKETDPANIDSAGTGWITYTNAYGTYLPHVPATARFVNSAYAAAFLMEKYGYNQAVADTFAARGELAYDRVFTTGIGASDDTILDTQCGPKLGALGSKYAYEVQTSDADTNTTRVEFERVYDVCVTRGGGGTIHDGDIYFVEDALAPYTLNDNINDVNHKIMWSELMGYLAVINNTNTRFNTSVAYFVNSAGEDLTEWKSFKGHRTNGIGGWGGMSGPLVYAHQSIALSALEALRAETIISADSLKQIQEMALNALDIVAGTNPQGITLVPYMGHHGVRGILHNDTQAILMSHAFKPYLGIPVYGETEYTSSNYMNNALYPAGHGNWPRWQRTVDFPWAVGVMEFDIRMPMSYQMIAILVGAGIEPSSIATHPNVMLGGGEEKSGVPMGLMGAAGGAGGGNTAPVIVWNAPAVLELGEDFDWTPVATDLDLDVVTWSTTAKPTDMTINGTTGQLQWTPAAADTVYGAAIHTLTLRAYDGTANTDQTYLIQTIGRNDAAYLDLTGQPDTYLTKGYHALDGTESLCLYVDMAFDAMPPGQDEIIMSQGVADVTFGWALVLNRVGRLKFVFSEDGTIANIDSIVSTSPLTVNGGERVQVRVDWDPTNTTNHSLDVYERTDRNLRSATGWTPLSSVSTASTKNLHSVVGASAGIGASIPGVGRGVAGNLYRAIVADHDNSVTVSDLDVRDMTRMSSSAGTLTDRITALWTITGSNYGLRATYFVRTSGAGGSDSANGRGLSAAFATLSKAATVAWPGGRVYIESGSYSEAMPAFPANTELTRRPGDTGRISFSF
jgi:hypothetical protein